jgi:selenophosphate synthetase-related protein
MLVGGGNPKHVGVEQKEEDQADGHEVHVDAEDDAAVVEVPATLHAADGVQGARYGDEGRKDDQRSGVVVREVREEQRRGQTKKNKNAAA